MKSLLRLCLACLLLLATKSIAQAVTTAECQNGCSSSQGAAAGQCQDTCRSFCAGTGQQVHYNVYIPMGCFADPTESYCIVNGSCDCECEYI